MDTPHPSGRLGALAVVSSKARGLFGCGLAALLAACSANSGGPSVGAVHGLSTKTAPPAVALDLSSNAIQIGEQIKATWATDEATACIAWGAWGGVQQTDGENGITIGPFNKAGTYTIGLTCSGPGGASSDNEDVVVGTPPAPTIQLDMTPAVIAPGGEALLTWSTTNATSCTGTDGTSGWAGTQPTASLSGFDTGAQSNSGQIAFDLTCTGLGGSTTVTEILTVSPAAPPPAPDIDFSANPALLAPGQSTSLNWSATRASSCTASGGSGNDGWGGSVPTTSSGTTVGPVAAAGAYSYTLTCLGSGGSTAQSIVVVASATSEPLPVSVIVDAAPNPIRTGQSAALTWSTANADACEASGSWSGVEQTLGSGVSTGTLTVPGVYSYVLTCTGPSGSNARTALLTVDAAPAAVTTFLAAAPTITSGGTLHFAWATTNATSCVGLGGTGTDGWAATQPTSSTDTPIGPITTPGIYVYTLQCRGSGGIGQPSSVAVTVNSANPSPAQVSSFAAIPSTISVGQAATLTWSTLGASSCTASGGTGSDGWNGSVGTGSSGTSTGNISAAGSYTYTLSCTGPGGAAPAASAVLNVNPVTSAATVGSFSVLPTSIQAGQSAVLAWTTANASACSATGGANGDGWNGSSPGTMGVAVPIGPIANAGSYTYTLQCTGPGGQGPASSVVLNVTSVPPAPPTVGSFSASPTVVVSGQSTTFNWTSTGASDCTAGGGTGNDGWSNSVGPSGSNVTVGPLSPAGLYTYTLVCTGPGGTSAQSTIVVDVASAPPVPVIGAFAIVPATVQTGGSATATWASLNATDCTASGGTGGDGWSGSVGAAGVAVPIGPISGASVVTYTLTCSGPGGGSTPASQSISVTATPPVPSVLSFTATPSALQTGQSATLAWTTANATACTASGGTGAWGGSVPTSSNGTSTGTLSSVGIDTYVLTCTGPGGTSLPASATVAVTAAPPVASILTFAAIPASVTVGQTASLSWSTLAASACTATGGTGSDGWSGSIGTSSLGTSIGPFVAAGTYVYTLTCNGPGGMSSPSSIAITVNAVAVAARIQSFNVTPSAVQVGQSTALSWTTSNASSCTAGGGTGSDGWSGTLGPSGSNVSVGPFTAAGTVTYSLNCLGAGGSSGPTTVSVLVSAATPPQPTVSLDANGANPGSATPGGALSLTWTSANATACVASGNWSGAQNLTSNGTALVAPATPGVYTYTLTCTGAGGSGSSSVQVSVMTSTSFDCGIPGLATAALTAPAASVISNEAGLCLLDCTVHNAGYIIDSTRTNYALLSIPLGIAGSVYVEVDDTATFPAGRQAGFVITNGTGLINASLLGGIQVETLLNGTVQEIAVGGTLSLQAAGLISVDPISGFAGFTTTKPFNSVALVASPLVGLNSSIKIYGACVSQR